MTADRQDRAGVPGPIPGTRMTPEVLRQVGRLAYLWAWPMVNLHNRRVAFEQVPTHGLIGGVMPAAPLNNLTMLHDYAPPEQRFVATPNQDVAYGFGILALEREPGVPLEHGWGTLLNAARFGTDYVDRTAAAKANIFANKPEESTYFFTDVDANGQRLHGRRDYSVTFPGGQLPPVKGFWSLTLYDQHHFFATNDIGRYSVGTKNQDLHLDQDGSLTISVQQQPPQGEARSNWLPAPDAEFTLFLRAYWPEAPIADGKWAPPPVISGR